MVNLAHAKAESLVLDPFCGTGTSLIEATFIGCRAVGVDAQKRMIQGTKKNLEFFGISAEGLVLADSRKIPLTKVDAIVTDPPYGRSSSTLKSTTRKLVQEVLASTYRLLGEGQRLTIALPIQVAESGKIESLAKNLESYISSLGFRKLESHKVFIHRTLTREIMIYERNCKANSLKPDFAVSFGKATL
jgi:tRNA (guanine10-N2)-dimethyltransferase